jgi:hypothetical protein
MLHHDTHRDTHRDTHHDTHRDTHHDTHRDTHRDTHHDTHHELTHVDSSDISGKVTSLDSSGFCKEKNASLQDYHNQEKIILKRSDSLSQRTNEIGE